MLKVDRELQFTTALLFAGKRTFRPMPWRPTLARIATARFDPYKILVSEIMLQQTQVDRVRIKYAEFIRVFPTIDMLARAPLSDVLQVWSGLGYNRRAKYLSLCARSIVRDHGGKFPETYEGLCALPGIGRSTAAGILAFAWNREVPMIDTNIRRILHRIFPRVRSMSDAGLYRFASALIPKGRGREWNYAMLDVAAVLCTARNHMDTCPFMELHGAIHGETRAARPRERFQNTRRYVRGRVMAILSEEHEIGISALHARVGSTPFAVPDILADLAQEGLLCIQGRRVSLPRDI